MRKQELDFDKINRKLNNRLADIKQSGNMGRKNSKYKIEFIKDDNTSTVITLHNVNEAELTINTITLWNRVKNNQQDIFNTLCNISRNNNISCNKVTLYKKDEYGGYNKVGDELEFMPLSLKLKVNGSLNGLKVVFSKK